MDNYINEYGKVFVGNRDDIFERVLDEILELESNKNQKNIVGLTGGSTPKAFYQWVDESTNKTNPFLKQIYWGTSDERFVPLTDDESNFGNADRMFLTPREISLDHKLPWPISNDPVATAKKFNDNWNSRFDADKCFDLCFLGIGDDCHTASIFPGSPLINSDINTNFTSVDVDGKGWRLTITPSGLNRCKKIIVLVIGIGKSDAIKKVFENPYDPENIPIQVLKNTKSEIHWYLDFDASSKLTLK